MTVPTTDRIRVAALVREVIAEILPGLAPAAVTDDRHLKDLGADSVDRVEIILALVDRLGLDRPLSDFNDLPNLGALVDLLASGARP